MDNLITARPGHKQEPEAALPRTGSSAAYNNLGFPWAAVFALPTVKYDHY